MWLRIDGGPAFHADEGEGRLIDVGCNEGRGLLRYAANGYSPDGFEVNSVAAASARQKGFTVHQGALSGLPSSEYHVAVMANVIEHLLEPRESLREIRATLRDEGELRLSTPNSL